jgi:hypothetical protein
MSGPTPQIATGRLVINYVPGTGRRHKCQLDFDWATTPPGVGTLIRCISGGDQTPHQCAIDFLGPVQPLFATTTSFVDVVAQYWNGTIWIPVQSASIGFAGTGGGTDGPAWQATLTFRDSLYKLDKIVLLEGEFQNLTSLAYAALPTALKTFVDSVLGTASGNIGNWYRSKSGVVDHNLLHYVQAPNKRLRRQEGLG